MPQPMLDVKILLDFLKNPNDADLKEFSPSAQLTSLETLSTMCTDASTAKAIRDLGGVKSIWNLCYNTNQITITNACFFALACIAQNDIYAQQDLTIEHVFSCLNFMLGSKGTSFKTKTLATYLLLSLVSSNKQGQNLIYKSGCLDSLSNLYASSSQNLQEVDLNMENVELCKILAKTLSYSISVPRNAENQERLSEILPWIINGIHSSKVDLEVACLSCELLAVTIEENKKSQQQAISCRAIETLILLISSLLPNKDDKCLGNAIVALSQVLTNASVQQLNLFLNYGGSRILLALIAKELSDQWVIYHVNQTLTLLMKCFTSANDIFNSKYYQRVSQHLVKLMKAISLDEFFLKISVQILSFMFESAPLPLPAPSFPEKCKIIRKPPKPQVALCNFSGKTRLVKGEPCFKTELVCDKQHNSDRDASSSSNKKLSYCKPCLDILPYSKHKAYSSILVQTKCNGQEELILDISKSNKEALRFSSGINASPTDNIFPHPPDISAISTESRCYNKQNILLKKSFNSKQENNYFEVPSMQRSIHVRRKSFRYSTPKSQKFISDFREEMEPEQTCFSVCSDSDILSICDDLIDKEVMNSVKKRSRLANCGSSGLLL